MLKKNESKKEEEEGERVLIEKRGKWMVANRKRREKRLFVDVQGVADGGIDSGSLVGEVGAEVWGRWESLGKCWANAGQMLGSERATTARGGAETRRSYKARRRPAMNLQLRPLGSLSPKFASRLFFV